MARPSVAGGCQSAPARLYAQGYALRPDRPTGGDRSIHASHLVGLAFRVRMRGESKGRGRHGARVKLTAWSDPAARDEIGKGRSLTAVFRQIAEQEREPADGGENGQNDTAHRAADGGAVALAAAEAPRAAAARRPRAVVRRIVHVVAKFSMNQRARVRVHGRRMRRFLEFAIGPRAARFSRSGVSTLAPMKFAASTSAFDRALSVEIAASEQIRMRVLAGTLAILLLGDQLLFLFARETFRAIRWKITSRLAAPQGVRAVPSLRDRGAGRAPLPTCARQEHADSREVRQRGHRD